MATQVQEAVQSLVFMANEMGDTYNPAMAMDLLARDVKNLLSVRDVLIYMKSNGKADSFFDEASRCFQEQMVPAVFDLVKGVLSNLGTDEEENRLYTQGSFWGSEGTYLQGIAALEGFATVISWVSREYNRKTPYFSGFTLSGQMEVNERSHSDHATQALYDVKNTWISESRKALEGLPASSFAGVGVNDLKNTMFQAVFDAYAALLFEMRPATSMPLRGMGRYTFNYLLDMDLARGRGGDFKGDGDWVLITASALSMGFFGRPMGYRPSEGIRENDNYKSLVSEGRGLAAMLKEAREYTKFSAVTSEIKKFQ